MSGNDGAEPGPSSSGQSSNQQGRNIASLLDALSLQVAQPRKKNNKEKYAFWETQPVMQFSEEGEVSEQYFSCLGGQRGLRTCSME